MKLAKYFWDLKNEALKDTQKILKSPEHATFALRMMTFLSRCDNPKEVFTVISKEDFIDHWPKIRSCWMKHVRQSDFRDWWETVYEQLVENKQNKLMKVQGQYPKFFWDLGQVLKEKRIEKGLSQKQLALSTGIRQPDISKIEEGKKNITLFTLIRISKILGIEKFDLNMKL